MSVLARVARLMEEGRAFVLASVTWVRGPSSGKIGAKAIIHPDGTVEGWVGGACAQPTLVRQALAALADGRARLLVLGAPDDRPGVIVVPMACSTEGAMEVLVEPMMPNPRVHIVGDSPLTVALAQMVTALDWSAVVHDGPEMVGVSGRDYVVVASQGHFDEPALETALATDAAYVGLVASEKRASTVKEWLRARGVPDEALARLHAPAGLDLGHTEHREIAVSVLAELVRFRAGGVGSPVDVAAPEMATDPVCGMDVDPRVARFVTEYDGTNHYFCAAGCQRAFEADPAAYV